MTPTPNSIKHLRKGHPKKNPTTDASISLVGEMPIFLYIKSNKYTIPALWETQKSRFLKENNAREITPFPCFLTNKKNLWQYLTIKLSILHAAGEISVRVKIVASLCLLFQNIFLLKIKIIATLFVFYFKILWKDNTFKLFSLLPEMMFLYLIKRQYDF